MNDDPDQNSAGEPLEKTLSESPTARVLLEPAVETSPVSPLGWSFSGRLLCAAAAAALLWLAVAWACGWLA